MPREKLEPIELDSDLVDSQKHAGFDYGKAILELQRRLSYEKIAFYMGYRPPRASCVQKFLRKPSEKKNAEPSHSKGEMLWALYKIVFKRKPPMSKTQLAGLNTERFGRRIETDLRQRGLQKKR